MKIFVAGHKGLAGSALVRRIENHSSHEWIGKTHKELELTDRKAVFDYLLGEKPVAVVVAAAKVGGILVNSKYPVEFLSENIQIATNVLDAAHAARVEKLIFLGSSCVYPKSALQPLKEEYLLMGPLEETNESYAIAKISGIKLVDAYRRQYHRNWISVMPTNLYGPYDNYDLQSSHVLPALVRKFYEAKIQGLPQVKLWGSGHPLREFLHSDDLAEAVLLLIENSVSDSIINIGSGEELSIRELASLVSNLVGFQGEVSWQGDFPDGTPRKVLDSSLIRKLGWQPSIGISEGLVGVIEDFKNLNYT